MKRGELWWADLGPHRPLEQTGRRPVVIWQSDILNRTLQSILVVPLTTNLDRAKLVGTALIAASTGAWRSIPWLSPSRCAPFRSPCSPNGSGTLSDDELAELELATDEALGRIDPEEPA